MVSVSDATPHPSATAEEIAIPLVRYPLRESNFKTVFPSYKWRIKERGLVDGGKERWRRKGGRKGKR